MADHLIPTPALHRWVIDLFRASGSSDREATLTAELPKLSSDERAHLVKGLPQLAEAVASLEEASPTKPAPSRVLPAEAPASSPAPANNVVVVNARHREDRYKVVSFSPRALVLEGKGTLPENVLSSLEVDTQPPLPLCAVTVSCTAVTGNQRLVMAPFALSADAARRLRELTKP